MTKELNLYWHNNAWCFDDEEKNVKAEPFVMGSSEIISFLAKEQKKTSENLKLRFSEEPFKESLISLKWARYQPEKWNLYRSEEINMEGWLCPVLYSYFEEAPKEIFVSLG